MSIDEEKLKALWPTEPEPQDQQQALEKVLQKSTQVTAVKDVASLFVGWAWVIFLGFGASAYSAKRRFTLHKQAKNNTKPTATTNTQSIVLPGEKNEH